MTTTQTDVRAAIVAALTDVAGLTPTLTMPHTITAGSAWPVWAASERLNSCVLVTSWYVFAALPAGDLATSVAAADEFALTVMDALFGLGRVERVEPWAWPADQGGNTIPTVRATLSITT